MTHFLSNTSEFIQVSEFLFWVAGAVGVAVATTTYLRYKKQEGTNKAESDTIQTYKDLLHARDLLIKEMQGQINILKSKVESLEKNNTVLQNVVTGKAELAEIIKVLTPVPALFVPGGVIDTFKQNQELTLASIHELKGLMGDRRNLDTEKGKNKLKSNNDD